MEGVILWHQPRQCTTSEEIPSICIMFDLPQNWVPLSDPCMGKMDDGRWMKGPTLGKKIRDIRSHGVLD